MTSIRHQDDMQADDATVEDPVMDLSEEDLTLASGGCAGCGYSPLCPGTAQGFPPGYPAGAPSPFPPAGSFPMQGGFPPPGSFPMQAGFPAPFPGGPIPPQYPPFR